jgi:hypothetical protein
MSNNLENVTLFFDYFQDTTDCFFFTFALNELEFDRCFFELCLLFLFIFNSRNIAYSLLALLYSYIIVSIRLTDDITSTSVCLFNFEFDLPDSKFHRLCHDEDRVKNFFTPLLRVIKEKKIFSL